MRTLGIGAVLLAAVVTAAHSGVAAAGKDAVVKPPARDAARSAAQATEAIRSALQSAVGPALEAAAAEKLKKVGVVVVPAAETAVDRRVASIVQDQVVDSLFPKGAAKAGEAVEWDVSGETHAALVARREAVVAQQAGNRKRASAPEEAPPPPELTCDGILAVTCRMQGANAAVDFALLRVAAPAAPSKEAPAARQRKAAPRQDPNKPLWKGCLLYTSPSPRDS